MLPSSRKAAAVAGPVTGAGPSLSIPPPGPRRPSQAQAVPAAIPAARRRRGSGSGSGSGSESGSSDGGLVLAERLAPVALSLGEVDVHRIDSGVGIRAGSPQRPTERRGQKRYKVDAALAEVETDLSVVRFAIDLDSDDRPVVLKRAKARALCEGELAVLRRVEAHRVPGCIRLLDVYDEGDTFVMVFPFYKKLRTRGCDLVDIRMKAKKLMTTLAHLHKLGIVHLDICTSNVMETDEGSPVLIDFGLSRFVGAEPHPVGRGTPGFVAPEILSSLRPCHGTESDVYSLGVVLGGLLEPFFPTEACLNYLGGRLVRPSTTEMIQEKLRTFLRERPDPNLSRAVYDAGDLLVRMLESDPAARITADMALQHPFLTVEEGAFLGTELRSFSRSPSVSSLTSSGRRGLFKVIDRS